MIKVILLIDCASEHDRKLLRGMMRYSKENGPWLFYRLSSDQRLGENREEWVMEWAKKWGADAIIGRWNDDKLSLLDDLPINIVLQNNKSRSKTFSNLTGDYFGTGRMAAQYFKQKCFVEYAFFGLRGIVWSEERCSGYRQEVENNGGHFSVYLESAEGDSMEQILHWLKSLPKPVALFCCDDAHANIVVDVCRVAGIRVPDEIAVLGVDNDELLCSISDPRLSSIVMDVERGGYMVCKLLHENLVSGSFKPFNVSISPLMVQERESTSLMTLSDPYARTIVNLIDEKYAENLQMSELLLSVPLSRRSIEMRFKKATGYTIYQYLLKVRVDHMAHRLLTTDRSYLDIAYEVGFHDLANVSRTFKKFKGCSPQEYLRKYCDI